MHGDLCKNLGIDWSTDHPDRYSNLFLNAYILLILNAYIMLMLVQILIQFELYIKRYIRVGYNLDIMRQSACLVLNPITVYSYGFLFNCTTVGQASDSMTALT